MFIVVVPGGCTRKKTTFQEILPGLRLALNIIATTIDK
jgi:hypothetical protein